MKKLLSVFALALMLPLAACADTASKFEAGKHYEVISEQASVKPEVKEYFSFYCGGCNAFEPIAQSVAKKLPDDVEFKKVHVDFIRAAAPEIQNALARAYLVAKNLFKRNRPQDALGDFRSFIRPSDRFSFPSGHTSCAFLFASFMVLLFPQALLFWFGWAAAIGMSRVFLGVHFPTDTLVGAILGLTVANWAQGTMGL